MYPLITFYFQNCFIYSCQCVLKLQNDFEKYKSIYIYIICINTYVYMCACIHTHTTHTHTQTEEKGMATDSSILAWRTP